MVSFKYIPFSLVIISEFGIWGVGVVHHISKGNPAESLFIFNLKLEHPTVGHHPCTLIFNIFELAKGRDHIANEIKLTLHIFNFLLQREKQSGLSQPFLLLVTEEHWEIFKVVRKHFDPRSPNRIGVIPLFHQEHCHEGVFCQRPLIFIQNQFIGIKTDGNVGIIATIL
jgi:hypothetical protein